jgi:hypothetical protein
MNAPPPDEPDEPTSEPVSFDKPTQQGAESGEPHYDEPFDPYRFGAPEHPVPPEYAPPGYVPPPQAPPAAPPYGGFGPYPGGPGGPGAPGPGAAPPYQYPPPPYSPYPLPKTGNGKAVAGMVLGIISIVFFWLTVLDAIPVVLGLIFSILGLNEAKRTGSGRGQAIAGIICSAIGAVFAVIFVVVVFSRIRYCIDNYNSGSSEFNNCVRHRL